MLLTKKIIYPLGVLVNKKDEDYSSYENKLLSPKNLFISFDIYAESRNFKQNLKFGIKWHNLNFQAVYNKMTKFQVPNERRKEMSYYTYDEFKKFISNEEDLRRKCAFEILYYCGLRKGELKGLTWKDIFFNKKYYLLISK